MADKAWKAWEREIARDHGGTRTGPTGRDTPDVTGVELIAPECKYQGRLMFLESDMQQARDNAERWGAGIPVLFLKEKQTNRRAVRLDYADWLRLYNLACIGAQHEAATVRAPMATEESLG